MTNGATRLDEADSTVSYIGHAPAGTPTSAPGWAICRLTVVGTETIIAWAGGSNIAQNIWDNRTSLSYS
jgi:hypothetical protein